MRSDFSCLRSSLRSPQDPVISWPLRRVLLPGCSRTACLGRVIVGMGLMMFLVAFSLGDVVLASPALFLILKREWHRLSVLARVADRLSRAQRRHR